MGCFNKDAFMQTAQLLWVNVSDDCSLMMSKRQRHRRKRKSERKFIPATSFLITVIEVQQKKKARGKREQTVQECQQKPSQEVEKRCLANIHTVYILTGHEQEMTSDQTSIVRRKSRFCDLCLAPHLN